MLQIIIETKWDSYDKEFESSEKNDTTWPIFEIKWYMWEN